MALIIVALISILSFLSREPGFLTRQWLRFLYQSFGWGAYVVPVAIGAVGVWLIWRHFGDQLPPVDPIRIAGGAILFVSLLTLMQAIVAAARPVGAVWIDPALANPAHPEYTPTLIWERAQACPPRPQELIDRGWVLQNAYLGSYDIARCGHGGGYIGALIQITLKNLVGGLPVFIIALVGIIGGVLMAARKTLKDALEYSAQGYERFSHRRTAQSAAAPAGQAARSATRDEKEERGRPVRRPSTSRAALSGNDEEEEEEEEARGPQPTPAVMPGRPSIVTGRGPAGQPAPGQDQASPTAGTPRPGQPAPPGDSPAGRSPLPGLPRPAGSEARSQPADRTELEKETPSGLPPRPGLPGMPAPAGSRPGAPGQPSERPGGPSSPGTMGPPPRPGTGPGPGGALPGRPPAGPPDEPDEDEEEEARPQGIGTPPPRPGTPPPGGGGLPRPGTAPGSGPQRPEQPGLRTPGESSPIPRPGQPGTGPRPAQPETSGSAGAVPGRLPGFGSPRPVPKPASPTAPGPRDNRDDIVFDDIQPDTDRQGGGSSDDDESPADQDNGHESAAPGKDANPAPGEARIAPPDPPAAAVAKVGTTGLTEKKEEQPAPGQPARAAASPTPANTPPQTPSPAPPRTPAAADDRAAVPARPPLPSSAAQPGAAVSTRPSAGAAGTSSPGPPSTPTRLAPRRAGETESPAPETRGKKDSRPEWKLPPLEELEPAVRKSISDEELRRRAEVIEQTLASFGAPGRVVEVNHGPVITQFGVEPDYIDGRSGKRVKVKVGKISSLADDLALSLAAPSIRIEAPVPGKGYVGIEVPNAEPSMVGLRDVMDTPEFNNLKSPLKLALGQDVSGQPVVADLTAMPHLLIAGTTGSGKSVCVNGIIATMLMTCVPDELKMIMVDPKRVELTNYNGIPHLMAPVVTELERIVGVLKWVQREMDDRYRKFAMAGARNITDYNSRIEQGKLDGDRLPYIIVIVDELADLMMLAPDETERVITRLAQMARATGIHIILSTQRPSVDVVTGLIKANFPARIAFAVATGVDSRVILDMPGAEKLLGRGDMLFQPPDIPMPVRMQGVFVSDDEIQRIVDFWRAQGSKAPQAGSLSIDKPGTGEVVRTVSQKPVFSHDSDDGDDDEIDDLFDEAVELVRDMEKASISLLQRHLRIGYTRAARLIDLMEERDVIGPHEGGSKPRVVLGPDGEPLNNHANGDNEEDE